MTIPPGHAEHARLPPVPAPTRSDETSTSRTSRRHGQTTETLCVLNDVPQV
ncbi:hypothetical protein [Frankia sp. QA3]|uniref:hypothetical protein n=1 Tax=Frankia sp. QA3 TaxID=710111 RepID=UPI0003043A93|nr:hypothetical protein [Frankia sp. QA3]